MHRLILFRHSEAVHSPRYRDHERPLTETGRMDAERAGARLAELSLAIDLAIVSDSRRTIETWEIAGAAFAPHPETRLAAKIYEAERRDLMDLARDTPKSVRTLMLVGHNPSIVEFAIHFAGRGEHGLLKRLGKGFPTSAIAVFEVEDEDWRKLRWGDGILVHYLT
ncbi:histidine phosphatase family protein [Rhodoblastus sp.]|jgi:phosphohistidine phosphatase|uniref:SixA phosphatase family protein n=1 Tax=Rhodoblastus sp. TaxID=1962975 RepID=UPI00260DE7C1|nr:histidine phosphatase family protein [Rhodoblastus sp.]